VQGNLSCFVSRGTTSGQFLVENFGTTKCEDIVYIGGSPYVDIKVPKQFHRVMSVWEESWDYDVGTVLPHAIYEAALRAIKEFPGKRFIVHFMQPHYPYLAYPLIGGPQGNAGEDDDAEVSPISKVREKALTMDDEEEVGQKPSRYKGENRYYRKSKMLAFAVYSNKKYLGMPKAMMVDGYRKNLEIVFPYAMKLAKILPNRTVITADHGEALGERMNSLVPISVYRHFRGFRLKALTQVPWLEIYPRTAVHFDAGKDNEGSKLNASLVPELYHTSNKSNRVS
jgi:hypothetical protein